MQLVGVFARVPRENGIAGVRRIVHRVDVIEQLGRQGMCRVIERRRPATKWNRHSVHRLLEAYVGSQKRPVITLVSHEKTRVTPKCEYCHLFGRTCNCFPAVTGATTSSALEYECN